MALGAAVVTGWENPDRGFYIGAKNVHLECAPSNRDRIFPTRILHFQFSTQIFNWKFRLSIENGMIGPGRYRGLGIQGFYHGLEFQTTVKSWYT